MRAGLREKGAVDQLEKFVAACGGSEMDCDFATELIIKWMAIVTLAYLVDETESDRINFDDTLITFSIEMIDFAITYNDPISLFGFSACEMINGLNKLAANDSNKRRIVEQGGLPHYAQLMSPSRTAKEQRTAASGLWTLAYKCDKEILANAECMKGTHALHLHYTCACHTLYIRVE